MTRHARAHSAAVSAGTSGQELLLTIDDDGRGFPDGGKPPWSVVSRVTECGGHCEIGGDGRPGAHLRIELPEG